MDTKHDPAIYTQKLLDGFAQMCNKWKAQTRVLLGEYDKAPEEYRQLGRIELAKISMQIEERRKQVDNGEWPHEVINMLSAANEEVDEAMAKLQKEPIIAFYDASSRQAQKTVPLPCGDN